MFLKTANMRTQRPANQIKVLAACLRSGELDALNTQFGSIASSPDHLVHRFAFLKDEFERQGKSNLFLDLLLTHDRQTFGRLFLIGQMFELGAALDRQDEVLTRLAELEMSGQLPEVRWGVMDRLIKYRRLSKGMRDQLCFLKHKSIVMAPGADPFEIAEKNADRVDIDQPLLSYLYANSRHAGMGYADWENQIRIAFCIGQLTSEVKFVARERASLAEASGQVSDFDDLVDQQAKREMARQIRSPTGTLVLVFHMTFLTVAACLYDEISGDGLRVKSGPAKDPRHLSADGNHRGTLFAAMRALQRGKAVLLGPDAGKSGLLSSISIFGSKMAVGKGAAFLAYETGCNTVWYSVVRRNGRFVPIIEPGPTRTGTESYEEFSGRLLGFYADRIESTMSGNPQDIVVRRSPLYHHFRRVSRDVG